MVLRGEYELVRLEGFESIWSLLSPAYSMVVDISTSCCDRKADDEEEVEEADMSRSIFCSMDRVEWLMYNEGCSRKDAFGSTMKRF